MYFHPADETVESEFFDLLLQLKDVVLHVEHVLLKRLFQPSLACLVQLFAKISLLLAL